MGIGMGIGNREWGIRIGELEGEIKNVSSFDPWLVDGKHHDNTVPT